MPIPTGTGSLLTADLVSIRVFDFCASVSAWEHPSSSETLLRRRVVDVVISFPAGGRSASERVQPAIVIGVVV